MRGLGRHEKESWIARHISSNQRVLHLGCTNAPNLKERLENGTLLHNKLLEINSSTIGLDIDAAGLDILRNLHPNSRFIHADANDMSEILGDQQFDIIVCGDIIEHLDKPGQMMASCRQHLKDDGILLLTTVNAFSIVRFLKAMLNHEAVHSEHTCYYSPKTLTRLASMNDLTFCSHGYYAGESGPNMTLNRKISNIVEKTVTRIWPQLSEGIVIKLQKTHTDSQASELKPTP